MEPDAVGLSSRLYAAGRRFIRSSVAVMIDHPVLTSFLVALGVRVVFAVLSSLVHEGVLIPDEGQYLTLALAASQGGLTADFWPGYGQSLFDSTRTFMWPLTTLFWLFGPSRLLAQLLPVLFGSVTAATTAAVAGRVVRRSYALTAGLIVALFPSQVLWSSVVLRESLVWAGLAGIAALVSYSNRKSSTIKILSSTVVSSLLIVALASLRIQTAALALWCLFLALLIGRGSRVVRVLSAVCFLLVVPWQLGMGPGAVTFAQGSVDRLGSAHAYMSLNADSSLDDGDVAFTKGSVDSCAAHVKGKTGEWKGITEGGGKLLERESGAWLCISDESGGTVLVDNRPRTSLRRVPKGLLDTMIQPLPWKAGWSNPDRFAAGLELPFWILLYVFSAYGAWEQREHFRQLIFPALLFGSVAVSGAMVHGNLGTAFRHRGQVLFAVAILAVGGLQAVADRRKGRQRRRDTIDSVNPEI